MTGDPNMKVMVAQPSNLLFSLPFRRLHLLLHQGAGNPMRHAKVKIVDRMPHVTRTDRLSLLSFRSVHHKER